MLANERELVAKVEQRTTELHQAKEEIEQYSITLEQKVAERTAELVTANKLLKHTNDNLENALNELKTAQTQLIQSEKMAALGQLIAGIAHEINTPIGAIKSSGENISESLNELTKNLPILFQKLDLTEINLFIDLIDRNNEESTNSSKE